MKKFEEDRKPGQWKPPESKNYPRSPVTDNRMQGLIVASDLAKKPVPTREWVVDDLIPLQAVTLLSGDGGTGKSLVALQLACCLDLGRPWLGQPTRKGKSIYVSCEDDEKEMHIRLADIAQAEGWGISDLENLIIIDRTSRENFIMSRERGFEALWETTPFWTWLSNLVTDNETCLLILDSLYDFFPGNQLEQVAARRFMGYLTALAHDAECAIVMLMHPSKAGMETGDGASGNRAFRNAARSMLYFEASTQADNLETAPVILRDKKSNRGPRGFEISLKWDNGRFVPVNAGPDPRASGPVGSIAVEQAFLNCLDASKDQHRFYTHSYGPSYAPKAFAKMRQASGFSAADLAKGMERLFADNRIENGQVGLYANRHPRFGIVRKALQNEAPQADENASENDLFSCAKPAQSLRNTPT